MDYERVFTKRPTIGCLPLGEAGSPKGVTTYTKEIAANSTGDVQSQIYLQSHWITANSYRNANNMRVVRLICTSFFSMVWKIYNLSFIFFNFCVFFFLQHHFVCHKLNTTLMQKHMQNNVPQGYLYRWIMRVFSQNVPHFPVYPLGKQILPRGEQLTQKKLHLTQQETSSLKSTYKAIE